MAYHRRDRRAGARQRLRRHPQYIYSFDHTGRGWVHLLLGVLAIVAGFAVLKGQMWARVVGIVMACLSMIANFLFVPHYPSGRY